VEGESRAENDPGARLTGERPWLLYDLQDPRRNPSAVGGSKLSTPWLGRRRAPETWSPRVRHESHGHLGRRSSEKMLSLFCREAEQGKNLSS